MRSIERAYWPIELLEYTSGVSLDLRSMSDADSAVYDDCGEDETRVLNREEPLIYKKTVDVGEKDLQFCRPIKAVESYRILMKLVAKLAIANRNYMLCYRGQRRDHPLGLNSAVQNVGHGLYPTLWRYDKNVSVVETDQLAKKLATLRDFDKRLFDEYRVYAERDPDILELMEDNPLVRWALLQHYEVCDTPVFDITRSLQVACSFASMKKVDKSDHINGTAYVTDANAADNGSKRVFTDDCATEEFDGRDDDSGIGIANAKESDSESDVEGYIYIFGLPHLKEARSVDSDAGLTCLSLLGITPYNAERPLIQDGYMVCDNNWMQLLAGYNEESVIVNFSERLLAVFKCRFGSAFWEGCANQQIPKYRLLPEDDEFLYFINEKVKDPI